MSLEYQPPSQENLTDLLTQQVELLTQQNALLANIQNALSGQQSPSGSTQVKIIDFNMPFGALVGLLIKVALAAIPALIIIGVCYLLTLFIVGGFITTLFWR